MLNFNPGTVYGTYTSTASTKGDSWYGDLYSFGTSGFNTNDELRCGGILGAEGENYAIYSLGTVYKDELDVHLQDNRTGTRLLCRIRINPAGNYNSQINIDHLMTTLCPPTADRRPPTNYLPI